MADDETKENSVAWGAGVDPDELAQMQRTPSAVVSRVYVRPYGSNVRIGLGEVIEGKTNWHSAITVSASDLVLMAELFSTQAKAALDWVESQRSRATQEQGDAE